MRLLDDPSGSFTLDVPRVDPARLRFLVELLERKEAGLASRTLDSFVVSAEQHLAVAQASGTSEAVRRALHSLKGASATFGAVRLVDMLVEAEEALRADLPFDLDAIGAELAATIDELRSGFGPRLGRRA